MCVGAEAFLSAARDAVARCRQRLLVQFSTFEGDASGEALAELLLEAAARGVDVRLSLDHYSDVVLNDVIPLLVHRRAEVNAERRRTRALLDRLTRGGVQLRRTAPVGRFGCYLLYRDHKKLVLADDVAFVGGINVSDHNFGWHDFMVRITGDVVADLARDFLTTWDGATVTLDQPAAAGDFVLNQAAGRPTVLQEIIRMIDGAQRSVLIELPYLLGDAIEAALRRAARRGAQVTVVIPWRANHTWARIWARSLLRHLDHPNVECFGYRGAHDMTHAKVLVVDARRATFGSFNMLELEGLTQKELNVFSDDHDLVDQLEGLVRADVSASDRMPVPRSSFGRFTYTWSYAFFRWWTRRLLRRPEWRKEYC